VENASVEFDGRTLSPTYRIVMGIPGESRAVDIAARNGLPQEIVEGARAYLEDGRSDVSALITGLRQKHQELDAAGESQRAAEARLREERRRTDLKELRLRQKELHIKTGELGSLRQLLTESRKTLENLVREVKEGELNREKTLKVKQFLSDLEQSVAAEDDGLDGELGALSAAEAEYDAAVQEETDAGRSAKGDGARTGRGNAKALKGGWTGGRFEPGAEVLVGAYNKRGTLLRADRKGAPGSAAGNSWIVEIGSLKLTCEETDLTLIAPSPESRKPLIAEADLAGTNTPQFELNLLGMRLDEALENLRRQIDGAVLAGLHEFSVVHGKGDGILQKGVHDYLKHQSQVADYYFSRPEQGGFGRTEVVLRQ
jgi:DNA mismatch repair protein MutS2